MTSDFKSSKIESNLVMLIADRVNSGKRHGSSQSNQLIDFS